MFRKGRYAHLRGSSAYYPFGARTSLRKRQRRRVVLLRAAGLGFCGKQYTRRPFGPAFFSKIHKIQPKKSFVPFTSAV